VALTDAAPVDEHLVAHPPSGRRVVGRGRIDLGDGADEVDAGDHAVRRQHPRSPAQREAVFEVDARVRDIDQHVAVAESLVGLVVGDARRSAGVV
jgi:hypothetical protein